MHEGPLLLNSGHALFVAPTVFDLATAPDAMSELDNLIELHAWVAVDLSAVEFIDSTGLSTLVWARNKVTPLGGGVVLFGASPRTLRMLEITQLDHVFAVYEESVDIPVVGRSPLSDQA
jgi:anti-sigma B factor antagonist